jgi:hypothetical protein
VLSKAHEQIEEISFEGTAQHVFSWSSRGQFCLSASDKRSLQPLSFFDSNLDIDTLNSEVIDKSKRNSEGPYSLEDDKDMILDISALMLHRYQAGYRLERIGLNEQLSSHFSGYWRQYSNKSKEAQHQQGIRAFWKWLGELSRPDSVE